MTDKAEPIITYRRHDFSGLTALYLVDQGTGRVSLVLLPEGGPEIAYAHRRAWMGEPSLVETGMDQRAWHTGALCHLALRHHPQGKGAGCTLKHGESTWLLRFHKQDVQETLGLTQVITTLRAEEGYEVVHTLSHYDGEAGFEVETRFENNTGRAVTLDLFTSFSLDNLSPYQRADAVPGTLHLHRFRGGWSLEGKHIEDSLENLNLEESWLTAFPESERFGGIGSHSVKRFFPFAALEDRAAGVFWGAQLEAGASWQIEFSHDCDCYSLSGGLADCEFASWYKVIDDGESFTAPKAFITATKGTLEDVCYNLTEMHHKYAEQQPISEQHLPVLFNEWCTSWGAPSHESILSEARRLQGTPVETIVIDAGWTDVAENSFGQGGNGDWLVSQKKFPDGLLATSRAVRALGFRLGLWFEFEVTTRGARVYAKDYDALHLKRAGEVLVTGDDRSFWDFRKPEVIAYLQERVIDLLRDNEISYLKVDYNGSIGVGCDGAESPGEGLRQHICAVRDFFLEIRRQLPGMVIENCASGGHRLEPFWTDCTAMSCFSDCHEGLEIPYIAANLHKLVLPHISQVWAVLKASFNPQRLQYVLASGFLGRMCLSGDIEALDTAQWDTVCRVLELYQQCAPVIKHGKSALHTRRNRNTRHPEGFQLLLRISPDNQAVLVVCHAFALPHDGELVIDLPSGDWAAVGFFGETGLLQLEGRQLIMRPAQPWTAAVCLLENRQA